MSDVDLSEIARASRRATTISVLGVAVVVASLIYAAVNLRNVEIALAAAEKEVAEKHRTVAELDAAILDRQEENETLLEVRNQLLREFGWNSARLSQLGGEQAPIHEVVGASRARRQVAVAEVRPSRSNIRIEYFAKAVDPELVVIQSLEELGFRVSKHEPKNPRQSNTIWFGRHVPADEVKLIAFTLLRAGIELKQISEFTNDEGREDTVQLGRGMHAYKREPLTVGEIQAAASLEFLAGDFKS